MLVPAPGGPTPLPFPDAPTGSPGDITDIARQLQLAGESMKSADTRLRKATSDLSARWDGTASQAYGAQANSLAQITNGAYETFAQCSRAASAYSTDLDDCQKAMASLKSQYDDAVKQVGKAKTTKDADNATTDANGYVHQAERTLKDFHDKARGHQSVLEGNQPGEPRGPLSSPFIPAGRPGPTFGIPAIRPVPGQPMPEPIQGGGPLPVGGWRDPSLPGYWFYLDSKGIQSTDDLTNAIVIFAPIGGKLLELAGAKALEWLSSAAADSGAKDAITSLTQALKDDQNGWAKFLTNRGIDSAGHFVNVPGGQGTIDIIKELIDNGPAQARYVKAEIEEAIAQAKQMPGSLAQETVQQLIDALKAVQK